MKKLLVILSIIIGLVILGVSIKSETKACWNCCKPRPTPTEEPTPTPTETVTPTPKVEPTPSQNTENPVPWTDNTCHTCPKSAPTCQDKVPEPVANAFAIPFTYGDYCQSVWWEMPGGASQVHIKYKENGSISWQHALLNTPNDAQEDICLLKDGVCYHFSVAGVNGCAVGEWSKVFSNCQFYP